MAKTGVITAVLAAVLTVAGAVMWVAPPQNEKAVLPREAAPTAAAIYAVIGEWEGKVAVFFNDGETPKTVYDQAVRTLPASEQDKLKNGIPVFSAKELAARLEDYTG